MQRAEMSATARRVLAIMALGNFASSLFMRAIDPMIPQVAHDLATDPSTVALLTTAFALPYAALQPVLGPLADMMGKTRLMTICLGVLVLNGFIGAVAPNFSVLMASRIVTGVAAGGIFPTALAVAGDLVPIQGRQVAISRLLAAGMLGNLLGTPMAGHSRRPHRLAVRPRRHRNLVPSDISDRGDRLSRDAGASDHADEPVRRHQGISDHLQ